MLSVIMLRVIYKPYILSVIMLDVIYRPFMLSAIMPSVVAPTFYLIIYANIGKICLDFD